MARVCACVMCFVVFSASTAWSQQPVIPHAQDRPPNEPRDAETAAKMMTVPEGFVVDVVAHEPDIVNPVAMTFDEKGRVWITESIEYPRKEPGPGKDRVKILEDANGDGVMDRFTVFLDGLNIPSGVAVGHGGVWVANSPDILFVPDKDRDGKPDGEPQVVVTGFGRTDTHELPNSLTWGPDGWLYGLNGVFNHSHVKYPKSNPNYEKAGGEQQPGWPITCAMFRIHPRTWEFQVFAEGTSNPWGIAFNDEGDAFISACVIDHLWHIVETGYYHRQGGPYPPHTWKIDSIVEHKHQKAAYCGITWFDSDAYPEQYRRKLYMGNIHGGCINVDRIERNGSTYKGFGEPDFLTANDAWFMPVVQKTGPDGCLWILDWYDRYHCYQDAGRDPAGIDRLKGRLYRVRYEGERRGVSPTSKPFDLAAESDDQLIEKLGHPNVWMRETAQRILQERNHRGTAFTLLRRIENAQVDLIARRHSVFAVLGISDMAWPLSLSTRSVQDEAIRAWALRGLFDDPVQRSATAQFAAERKDQIIRISDTSGLNARMSPPVALQNVIGISKLPTTRFSLSRLLQILAMTDGDRLMPHIVWQALHPRLEEGADDFLAVLEQGGYLGTPSVLNLLPRAADRMLARKEFEPEAVSRLLRLTLEREAAHGAARQILANLAQKIETGELAGGKLDQLREALNPVIQTALRDDNEHALKWEASLLALSWRDRSAVDAARKLALNPKETAERRIAALNALIAAKADGALDVVASALRSESEAEISNLKSQVLQSAGRLDDPQVGEIVLSEYAKLPPDLQPKAVELLTQRAAWAKALLKAIGEKTIPADVINLNQARRLRELKDEELAALLKEHWGELRDGRNPDRERVVAEMKAYIREHQGDELNGEKVFKKVCGQCHKLYGEGVDVGPDITRNGRNDYQQLLSNVFDPSLVIGAGYRSYTVLTTDGRAINGLLVEESPQRVVLKVQGGKQEIVPRDDIDEFKVSEISLMPEQLEKQITLPEIADLFAYITLDRPPSDPEAKRLPGVYEIVPRQTTNPAEFASVFQEAAPGFTAATSGEGGVALLAEYRGRKGVVRTHPVSKDHAAIMRGKFAIPKDKKTTLVIEVSHDERGDWRLLGGARGERLLDEIVSDETCPGGWGRFTADLSKFAGQEVEVQVWNQANNWAWEFAYWGSVRIVSE